MATDTKPDYPTLMAWVIDGLQKGNLKLAPIEDDEGRIMSISIILDSAGEIVQPDPRQALPDGGRRQAPDRYRKARPL